MKEAQAVLGRKTNGPALSSVFGLYNIGYFSSQVMIEVVFVVIFSGYYCNINNYLRCRGKCPLLTALKVATQSLFGIIIAINTPSNPWKESVPYKG